MVLASILRLGQLSLLLSVLVLGDGRSASGSSPGIGCTSHVRTRGAQTVSAWDANTWPGPANQRLEDPSTRTKYRIDNFHVARKCSSGFSAVQTRYLP